jgi:hypothetical protein
MHKRLERCGLPLPCNADGLAEEEPEADRGQDDVQTRGSRQIVSVFTASDGKFEPGQDFEIELQQLVELP